jgi:hypothetical protein
MDLRGMTLKELEDLRFTLECEILERTGFSPVSFDSFDTQVQAEELRYTHSVAPLNRNFSDYVEF